MVTTTSIEIKLIIQLLWIILLHNNAICMHYLQTGHSNLSIIHVQHKYYGSVDSLSDHLQSMHYIENQFKCEYIRARGYMCECLN